MYIPFTHVGTDMYVYQAYQALPYRIDVHMYLIRTNIFTRTCYGFTAVHVMFVSYTAAFVCAFSYLTQFVHDVVQHLCIIYRAPAYLYSNLLNFIAL